MVKLFVGQIPRTMEEDGVRPIMEEYGPVKDVKIIRDKVTGAHKGCCFVTYDTQQEATAAINGLHNVKILGNLSTPMQVKFAEGEPVMAHKLFVGMLTKATTETDLTNIFQPFGEIEEVAILKGPNNIGKGCGFVRYKSKDSALKAITALNGAYKLEGAPGNLIVKLADSEKFKQQKKAQAQALVQPHPKPLDPNAIAALYQANPLLANIATNPLAATLLPTIAAALGIQGAALAPPPPAAVPVHPPGAPPPPPYYPYLPAPTSYFPGAPPAFPPPPPPETPVNAPQKEGPAGCNLFIYHLPQEYTDSTLSQLFAPYGNVLSAKVFVDKLTLQSKCFGFVSYDKPESASAAIGGLNGMQLGYKRLKVSLKKADSRSGAPY